MSTDMDGLLLHSVFEIMAPKYQKFIGFAKIYIICLPRGVRLSSLPEQQYRKKRSNRLRKAKLSLPPGPGHTCKRQSVEREPVLTLNGKNY